jgi:hypothetical protein
MGERWFTDSAVHIVINIIYSIAVIVADTISLRTKNFICFPLADDTSGNRGKRELLYNSLVSIVHLSGGKFVKNAKKNEASIPAKYHF